MKYRIYKPNPRNNGCAGTVDIAQVGADMKTSLFISMIQQSGWDDQKKTGSFAASRDDASKNINFKLSVAEAGEIISSFQTRIPFVAFHKFNDDTTVIRLTPWDKIRKVKEKDGEASYKTPAWGFSVTRNGSDTFKLPLEAGEAEVVKIILKQFIEDALFEESQNQSTEKAKKSSDTVKKSAPKAQENKVDEDEEDVPF